MKLVLGVVAVLGLGILFAIASLIATDPGDNTRLLYAGSRQDSSGTRFVTGVIENLTRGTYSHVQVDIDLLDEDGGIVGNAVADTTNLSGGETWTFEVPVLKEVVVQDRLRKLTCSKRGEEPHPRACFILPTLVRLPGQS